MRLKYKYKLFMWTSTIVKKYWVVQKVIAFFPIDSIVHVYLYASVIWMSNARFIVDST